LALHRIGHAATVLGEVELDRLLGVAPVWRPLFQALTKAIPVRWVEPGTPDVGWFGGELIQAPKRLAVIPELVTCANPRAEVIEALRWARSLLASGRARPEDIAICAASTDEWDEHFLALGQGAGMSIHMSNGVPALSTRDGQACASLADTLISGLSQDRVRRLFAHSIGHGHLLKDLPRDWAAGVSPEAGLFQVEHWQRALAAAPRRSDGFDIAGAVAPVLTMLARGTAAAVEAGTELLRPSARAIWGRALGTAPPEALELSLQDLRLSDATEAGASIAWCPATHLVGSPRPWVWLLGLTSGTWPVRRREDALLPDHLLPRRILDPDPISERQRRAFQLICSRATSGCFISRSRRTSQGGIAPASPLLADATQATALKRGRIPQHAFSETDRLLARPEDAANSSQIRSASACWRAWHTPNLTAHDGLIAGRNPIITRALKQTQSATSLRRLLRDPIAFVWRYALGWQAPAIVEEPLSLDARVYGELVHELLKRAVDQLEPLPGYTRATKDDVHKALGVAVAVVRDQWPLERAIPPLLLWQDTLQHAERLAFKALTSDESFSVGTRCWTEVPFGDDETRVGEWPWDSSTEVSLPGTEIRIRGSIDRVDLNPPRTSVRVTDYKTGVEPSNAANVVIGGGTELQRVVYAVAARQLLPNARKVVARLFYLREETPRAYGLDNIEQVVEDVCSYVAEASALLEDGRCLPGMVRDEDDEYRLALPAAIETYLFRVKGQALRSSFGPVARIWRMP